MTFTAYERTVQQRYELDVEMILCTEAIDRIEMHDLAERLRGRADFLHMQVETILDPTKYEAIMVRDARLLRLAADVIDKLNR